MKQTIKKELILLEDLGGRFATEKSKKKRRFGLYRCYCGKEFEAQIQSINNGNTKSCGCLKNTHKKQNDDHNQETDIKILYFPVCPMVYSHGIHVSLHRK